MNPPITNQPGPPPVSAESVEAVVRTCLEHREQPSAWELVERVVGALGPKARWYVVAALEQLVHEGQLQLFPETPVTRLQREYILSLLNSDDLNEALNGKNAPRHAVESTIDALVHRTRKYRNSRSFAEMLQFMAGFCDYAPFNNMLVRLQDPSCSFFATAADWTKRFGRSLKEDARSMLILAPMHPVMVVYALDQTDGPPVPDEILNLSRFGGEWEQEWTSRTLENAARDRIRIQFKLLSSTNSGFAQLRLDSADQRTLRIVIHDQLDEPSRYGVLCHELAHIYLGHLGGNEDGWWPGRASLGRSAIEFEAESTAYVVTSRLGLQGSSDAYLSRYTEDDEIPNGVSLDLIAKVSHRIEEMARVKLPPRPAKPPRRKR